MSLPGDGALWTCPTYDEGGVRPLMAMNGASNPMPNEGRPPRKRWRFGLSAKVLLLTAIVVIAVEVALLLPTIASYRLDWLSDRLAAARTAAMVLDAAPGETVPPHLTRELLNSVGAHVIVVKSEDSRRLLAMSNMPVRVDAFIDMRHMTPLEAVMGAMGTLLANDGRILRVVGDPEPIDGEFVEIVLSGTPLSHALKHFAMLALIASLVVAGAAGVLIYFSLNWMFVKPMLRLSERMESFRNNPEDASRIITPSGRSDEIGTAEEALAEMQRDLVQTLQQKSRLAALGLAVSKINHDLRNLLASAQLISDRLVIVPDPTVQRFAPKLLTALDRAITYCEQTLSYGRAMEPPSRRQDVALSPLLDEVRDTLRRRTGEGVAWVVDVPPGMTVYADPDQLFRVLLNLTRNAVEALELRGPLDPDRDEIRIRARHRNDRAEVEVADTGPGIPQEQRGNLFQAFSGSTRRGGTGLGLSIASELVHAHGGQIQLLNATPGTTFRFTLPHRGQVDEV